MNRVRQVSPAADTPTSLSSRMLPDVGWCAGEPITDAGKRKQQLKMTVLLLCPILVLVGVGVYFLIEQASIGENNKHTRRVMEFSIELGSFTHILQRERDQSVLYLSNIGPSTKIFLVKRQQETDEKLESLSKWPSELNSQSYFESKEVFKRHLMEHRSSLDIRGETVFEELEYYNRIINILQKWVYNAVPEKRYTTMWKPLVAYHKVMRAISYAGVERALGANALSRGGFTDRENYLWFYEAGNKYRHMMKYARKFSDIVDESFQLDTEQGLTPKLAATIKRYRDKILNENLNTSSLNDAVYYFDNMTNYIDILFVSQESLAKNIIRQMAKKDSGTYSDLAIAVIVLILVIVLTPFMLKAVYIQTCDIQSYAHMLSDKTKELHQEKEKTESLLHQMLPKSVVQKLAREERVKAEYFKHATVFFSDVVGFTSMSRTCEPMQIVAMLNELYILFDERIDHYDVYKVETIKDSYMVTSGIPERNGSQHAAEVARLALDFLLTCKNVNLEHVPRGKVRLRIGIHTGPVMAGIVGIRLPRYCLFGDTVNTASRMETSGQPNMIHISHVTYEYLTRIGGFNMRLRGKMDVKGKGSVTTYWLLGMEENKPSLRLSHQQAGADTTLDEAVSTVNLQTIEPDITIKNHNPPVAWVASAGEPASQNTLTLRHVSPRADGNDLQDNTKIESFIAPSANEPEDFPPPSYRAVEQIFREKIGSPPILQLQEGYHF